MITPNILLEAIDGTTVAVINNGGPKSNATFKLLAHWNALGRFIKASRRNSTQSCHAIRYEHLSRFVTEAHRLGLTVGYADRLVTVDEERDGSFYVMCDTKDRREGPLFLERGEFSWVPGKVSAAHYKTRQAAQAAADKVNARWMANDWRTAAFVVGFEKGGDQ